ncbi:MAG: endo-1,3-alpha-glucanase family glycosylhydrolase [Victivallales bacterium]
MRLFVRSMLVVGLFCVIGFIVAAQPHSVDELPVDRFDEYQTDSLPPYPWMRLGKTATDVDVSLKTEAESPFCGNKVTGKGLTLNDSSAAAGSGSGISCKFTPPPEALLYLGFDFRYSRPEKGEGADFVCRLDDGSDRKGLALHIGEGGGLSITGPDGNKRKLTTVEADKWYHLAVTLTGDEAAISLADAEQCLIDPYQVRYKKPPFAANEKFLKSDSYNRLAFISSGPDDRTGGWSLDNVCMAGKVDAARDALLPFERELLSVLRQSEHKVYAYYFIYTNAYDDKDPGLSWFTRTLLNPSLNTKGDRKTAGSELLYRPLPRPPMQQGLDRKEIKIRAMEEEVRLAIQQGIDGFLADFHSYPADKGGVAYFTNNSFALMDAALRVDPGFKIIPAVYSSSDDGADGEGEKNHDPVKYANSPVIKRIAEHPAALRTPDGRLVMSMWLTERFSVDWWKQVIKEMEKNGHPIALIAQFNSWNKIKDFSEICYGMSHWGPRSPGDFKWVGATRQLTEKVIFPIVEQDVRTRGCWAQESENSSLLRGLWEQAITDKADWAFIYTWSDYTEQAMAPSTFIGFVPYDLNTYYSQWFKTGRQPKIVRDTLYYFYRRNHSDVDPGKGGKWSFRPKTPKNEIELLAFLTEPGTLSIQVAGQVYEKEAPAGIASFKAPLPKDKTFVPEFSLRRNAKAVIAGKGRYTVLDKVEYPHMIYCSGMIAP